MVELLTNNGLFTSRVFRAIASGSSRRIMTRALTATGLLGVVIGSIFATFAYQPVEAATGINRQINFQGKLVNANGTNIPNGTYNLQFKLYTGGNGCVGGGTSPCSGTLQWTEERLRNVTQGVTVTDGIFQVNLGSITSLPVTFNDDTIWLSINLGNTNASCTPFSSCSGDGEMLPFIRFTAAPYALNSDLLDGLNGTQFARTDANNTLTGSQTVTNTGTAALAVQNAGGANMLTVDTSNGRVGINLGGANNPTEALEVNGNIKASSGSVFKVGSAAGVASTCSGGQVMQDQTVVGGIVTGGTCATAASTLQGGYDNSTGGTTPEVKLDNTRKGLDIQDADSAITSSNLFNVRASNGAGLGNILFGVSGTGVLTVNGTVLQTASLATGTANTLALTNSASSGTTAVKGLGINLVGTNNAGGTNALTGLDFGNVAAATNNSFYGINFGTGFNDLLRYNSTQLISGTGFVQNAAIDASVTYTNLQKVGALNIGSIASGFGVISTGNNITTTAAVQGGTGVFTAASGLTLGTASSATGGIIFKGSGGAGTLTLQGPATPNASNYTLSLPAITASATICTDNSVCTGYQSSTNAVITNPTATQTINSSTNNITGLVVRGSSHASLPDIFAVQTSTPTTVFKVNSAGRTFVGDNLYVGTTSVPAGVNNGRVTALAVDVNSIGAVVRTAGVIGTGSPVATNVDTMQLQDSNGLCFWRVSNMGTTGSHSAGSCDSSVAATLQTTVRSGDVTGAFTSGVTVLRTGASSGGNTGAVTITTGNAAAGISGAITVDPGTGSGGTSGITVGGTNASAVAIGHTGITTTVTGNLSHVFSGTSGTGATYSATDSSASGTTTVQGVGINLVGTNTSGTNTLTGLSFGNVAAATNNTFYGMSFGTGLTDLVRYNGTQLISGTGFMQNAAVDSALTYSNLQKVGALNVGSITSGFGTIATANTITGTTINGTTGINTGATAGIQRIDVSGNLLNIGNITGTGAVTIATASSGALALQPAAGGSLTGAVTKNAATGNEVAYDLATTINKATSGNYTGLKLNVTETLAPGAANLLIDLQVGGTSKFNVNSGGNITSVGTGANTLSGQILFSAVGTDITTPSGEHLTLVAGGTGQIILNDTTQISTLGATNTADYLCRNASNQFAACTAAATAFVQGGNSFGVAGDLGTNDTFGLNIRTNNATRLTVSTTGDLTWSASSAGNFDHSTSSGTFKTGLGAVTLNGNTTLAAGKTLSVTSALTSLTGATSGDAVNVSNSTSTGNIAVFKDNTTTVATIANGGATTFRNETDSTSAFSVQTLGGSMVLNADTVNQRVGIGTNTPGRTLHVAVNDSQIAAPSILLDQAGSGDTNIEFKNSSANFYAGIDNSDGDTFKINSYAAAGSGSAVTSGSVSDSGGRDSGNNNMIGASLVAATATGTVNSISVYVGAVDVGNPTMQVAIYTDNTGNSPSTPGTLLGNSTTQTLAPNSWNTFAVGASVTNGVNYWLAFNVSGSTTQYAYANVARSSFKSGITFGTWPGSYGSESSNFGIKYDINMSITPGGVSDYFTNSLFTLGGTGSLTLKNSVNSTNAFTIQNAAATSLFTVDTTNSVVKVGTASAPTMSNVVLYATYGEIANVLRIGDATNGFEFDKTNGITYRGTGRPTKRIALAPEFPGVSMTAASGCSTCTGSMTSDAEPSAGASALPGGEGVSHTYYSWTTTQAANQQYDVWVNLTLPSDFSAFASSNPMFVWTKTTDLTNGTVTAQIYDADRSPAYCYGGASDTPGSLTPTTTANQWQEKQPGNPTSAGCAFAANDRIQIRFRMQAPQNGTVKLGEMRFDYLAKF